MSTKASFLDTKSTSTKICHRISETPMLYHCILCGKRFKSYGGYAQHLKSRKHVMKSSQMSGQITDYFTMIKPHIHDRSTSSGDISNSGTVMLKEMDEVKKLDVLCCFVCDRKHGDMESCMVHLRINHGLFIPDAEYLIDPIGLLNYINIKVKREFTCLFCNERCHPFRSLEAVRKHMIDKWHCRLRYGDGTDDEEGELEDFFDYSSSYLDEAANQLVPVEIATPGIELGIGGAELIITRKTDSGIIVRSLGHRAFHLCYRQKPRPSRDSYITDAILKASRCQSKRVVTVQSKENFVKKKILREMNHRTKLQMKNRELPKRKY